MQSALENSEDALDTVRGDVIAACFVVDRFMLEKHGAEAIVCARFVRVGDLSNDRSLECAFIGAGYRAWLHPSAALAHSQDSRFADCPRPALRHLDACLFSSRPPTYVSSISMMPCNFSRLGPHASRRRCKTNHALFCVIPISLASSMEEMPLRAVTSRYIA